MGDEDEQLHLNGAGLSVSENVPSADHEQQFLGPIIWVSQSHIFVLQVKRTLFINGISKYAEEMQIKQHFE